MGKVRMIRKKNKYLTFLCSLVPGAGEMYMGFMKHGVSIMVAFWLLLSLSLFLNFLNFTPLLLLLPVLWFYSFFHVHNLRSLPDEEFCLLEDDYLFHLDGALDKLSSTKDWGRKQRNFFAGALALIGVCLIWSFFSDFLYRFIEHFISGSWVADAVRLVIGSVPKLAIGIFLIAWGISLIRSKKEQLDEEEES